MQPHIPAIKGRKGSVAVLDIGTGKVVCFIAEPDTQGQLHIIGIGHQVAQGMKAGVITEPAELETSIIAAVHTAEQMAGVTVEHVVVNISGAHVRSHHVTVQLSIPQEAVGERDIAEILREGCRSIDDKSRVVIHCFSTEYRLDDARGVRDPRGMYGSMLCADLHIITADNTKLRNIAACVARAHLNVIEFIATPHASALACLSKDEAELGTLVLDIGAGQTCVSVLHHGVNMFIDVIPIGGQHVTADIAVGLSTSIHHAERLKTLHGSAHAVPQDNQVMIDIPQIGEEEEIDANTMVPRAELIGIIRPRFEEIFELVREHLEAAGLVGQLGRTIVLTGGASQLLGLRELAAQMFGKHARTGRPQLVPGLAESVSGAAFSAAAGMLHYIAHRPLEDTILISPARQSHNPFALWVQQSVNRLRSMISGRG